MFTQSIDQKKKIIDNNGNEIVDLTKSIFARSASAISGYRTVKMTETYNMRPDKASFDVYGNENFAEMILKYSGISNPFSLGDDDILMIPEMNSIYNQLATDVDEDKEDEKTKEVNIRNYYKFTSKYKSDSTSYDALANLKIDSGVIDQNIESEYMVPYISDDGRTAVTIRNGRMYFGEDAGEQSNGVANGGANGNGSGISIDNGNMSDTSEYDNISNVPTDENLSSTLAGIYANADIISGDENKLGVSNGAYDMGVYGSGSTSGNADTSNFSQKMQAIIDSTATALADQCAINGMSMVDFTRASIKNR